VQHWDVAVVGGGIVGLAAAHRLLVDDPARRVVVLEAEDDVGGHQSSHNSGVLHAGVYYAPGSLKARLCTAGKAAMERFCDEHGIPRSTNGKVVVALEPEELPRLDELHRRCVANGVPGVALLDAAALREVEPGVAGIAAVHSPGTGVTDFAAVCAALAGQVRARGGEVHLGARVTGLQERTDAVRITTATGLHEAAVVLTCAGLQSDRVAAMTGVHDDRIVPFRGGWLEVTGPSADLVRGNVYPVPDPALPFLGVHATRGIDGQVLAGPNAVLALSREDRGGRWAVDVRDAADALTFPGLWRLGRQHLRAGLRELRDEVWLPAAVRELRRYLPGIDPADVARGPFGVRAQALRPDGSMVEDFVLASSPRVVHVRNAPSPAATSSLAIGDLLVAEVTTRTP
jgi:L-2-hydroxyglutarate oxidase LhgO